MVARKPFTRTEDAAPTTDSFNNFIASSGIGTNNVSSGGTYGFNPVSRIRTLIEWMYRGSWICGVGVDCVADDMTREGIEFSASMPEDDAELMQSALRRFQIWQSLNGVGKWARLYGGSLGYIAIKGQNPSTPLRLETVQKGQFEGLIVLDRWMVNPDLTRAIKVAGPDFGLPEFYDVVASSFQFPFPNARIHWSRLVRMEGVELPYWQKISENMWGISVLERLYDRLIAFDSTTQGTAQLVYKAYIRTLKVKNFRQLIATGGKALQGLTKQIEAMRMFQGNEGITLIDSEDDFDALSYAFSGLDAVLDKMGEQIAGALQIPIARLFGQSPGGMNATGDHELKTYYDNIKRLQERWFRRPMDVILRIVAASEGIEIPEGFEYEFASLYEMSDKEKAEVNESNVRGLDAMAGLGFPKRMILQEARKLGRRTGNWSSITDADIKDADDDDEAMPSPAELIASANEPGDEESEGNAPATKTDDGMLSMSPAQFRAWLDGS